MNCGRHHNATGRRPGHLADRARQLRVRGKAATRELDEIAAQRRRLPMVETPDYRLTGAEGAVRLVDVFAGHSQVIVVSRNRPRPSKQEVPSIERDAASHSPGGRCQRPFIARDMAQDVGDSMRDEAATGWHRFNEQRLHSHCHDVPPAEFESAFCADHQTTPPGRKPRPLSLHRDQGGSWPISHKWDGTPRWRRRRTTPPT